MKTGSNGFRGLNTDVSAESIGDGYFIDAIDIRLSTDTGESNNAVTNIKGNSLYLDLINNLDIGDGVSIDGVPEIIGHCTIRNRVVLFVGDDSGTNGWIISFLYDDVDKSLGVVTNHYKNPNLNFKKENPIEALGRFESENVVRVYWTDYQEYFRTINLFDPDLATSPLGHLDIFTDILYKYPKLTRIENSGNLKAGIRQYSYRLKTFDGKETFISPPGNLIHTVSSSEHEPQLARYVGNEEGTIANKSYEITIDTSTYGLFESVELIVVYKESYSTTPEIYSVGTKNINGLSEVVFIHNGFGEEVLIDTEEFILKQNPFKTAKTLATKDNLLLLSNLKSTRFDTKSLLSENDTFSSLTGRYNSNSELPIPNPNTEQELLSNAFNESYNKDAHWDIDWHKNKQYKYQSNGSTLGGEGPNISYKFHLEPNLIDSDIQPGFNNLGPYNENPVNLNDGVGNYPNNSYDSMGSPFKSGLLKGYKRGETYRFGIVFYNKKGEPSFVELIGDIKFPDISDEDGSINITGTNYFPTARETSRSGTSIVTTAYALGIEFSIDFSTCPSLLNNIQGYQIVRVKRELKDTRRLCSGIIKSAGRPLFNYQNYLSFPHYRNYMTLTEDSLEGSTGVNGNFYTLSPDGTAARHRFYGSFLAYHSPEISYDYGETIDTITNAESALLITGRYGQYYSNPYLKIWDEMDLEYKSIDFREHRFIGNRDIQSLNSVLFTNTSDSEELGIAVDFRRKMRTVGKVDKHSAWTSGTSILTPYNGDNPLSYTTDERAIEYIRMWRNNAEKRFNTNNVESDEDRASNLATVGPFPGTDPDNNPITTSMSSLYIITENFDEAINKGASNISGSIVKIDNDPITGLPLNKFPKVDHFTLGIRYEDNNGNSLVTSEPDLIHPLNKNQLQEDLLSTPIVDNLLIKNSIYNGFTKDALESNVFISASIVISKDLVSNNSHTFRVFGGDIFINMWTFQSNTALMDRSFYDDNSGISGNEDERPKNITETAVFPIESRINLDIDHGATLKRGVKYTTHGGDHGRTETVWRQETQNSTTDWGKTKNMYAYNSAYSEENDLNVFFVKPGYLEDLDSDVNDIRTIISLEKFNNESIDSWTKFPTNNFYDVDDRGPINKLISFRNEVYFFQDKGVGKFDINPRAIVTSQDGVPTELGTGQGLQDHQYLTTQNGSIHQWAVQATDSGIYYWDSTHSKLFIIQEGNQPLSEVKGIHSLVNSFKGDCLLRKENEGDNPILGKGVHMGHDKVNDELFITFMGLGQGEELVSETLVYDEVRREFAGRRSARPPIYIDNGDLLLSPDPNNKNKLFRHNHGNWGEFYGNVVETSITLILNADSPMNKILRTIEFNSIVRDSNKTINRGQTITGFRIKTEYQDTNKVNFSSGRIKRKFDKWRLKIPRDQINNSGRDRLRSSYFELTLYFDNSYNKELILNTINYHYDIQIF